MYLAQVWLVGVRLDTVEVLDCYSCVTIAFNAEVLKEVDRGTGDFENTCEIEMETECTIPEGGSIDTVLWW